MNLRDLTQLLSTQRGSIFRRNFVRLAKANTLALALPFLAAPILTRLFSPGDFSTLAVFSATLALIASVCTLRFDWLLPNNKSKSEAGAMLIFGLISLLISSLAIIICLLACEVEVPNMAHSILWLLPVAVIGSGLYALLVGWQIRTNDLLFYGKTKVTQSITNVSVSIAGGLLSVGTIALVIALVLATWAGISTLATHSYSGLKSAVFSIRWKLIGRYFKRNSPRALWSSLVSLVNATSTNATVLMLAFFFLPHEVGWYAFVHRLVLVPLSTMTSALGSAFWSETASYVRNQQASAVRLLYIKTTKKLIALTVPVTVLCLLAPFYIGPIFGNEQWGDAGYIMMAMTPLFAGYIIFSPTNHLIVFNQQKLQLLADVSRLTLTSLAIVAAHFFELTFITTVLLASLGSFSGHFLLFLTHLWVHKKYV